MGQREGRRRRVLREDAGATTPSIQSRTRVASSTKTYADEALVELQPRVTDLIPQRVLGLFALLLLGVSSIATINAIYVYGSHRWDAADTQAIASLNVQGPGSIANWLSSTLLLLAAAAALVVYNTRRHKVDDYRGRYGLWVWMAVFCLAASLDVSTGLHNLLQIGLQRLTGTALWGDGSVWWIAIAGLMGLLVGGRALADMWSCREGVFFLALAAACYLTATLNQLGVSWPRVGPNELLLQSSVLMLGHFFVLYSFLLYARNIYREAQGLIVMSRRGEVDGETTGRRSWFARRRQQSVQATTAGQANSSVTSRRSRKRSTVAASDPVSRTSTQPATKQHSRDETVPTKPDDSTDIDEAELDLLTNPELSKTERRKLRKKSRREQQQQRRAA